MYMFMYTSIALTRRTDKQNQLWLVGYVPFLDNATDLYSIVTLERSSFFVRMYVSGVSPHTHFAAQAGKTYQLSLFLSQFQSSTIPMYIQSFLYHEEHDVCCILLCIAHSVIFVSISCGPLIPNTRNRIGKLFRISRIFLLQSPREIKSQVSGTYLSYR